MRPPPPREWGEAEKLGLPQAVPRVMSLATPFPRTRLPGYSVALTVSLPAGTGASRG